MPNEEQNAGWWERLWGYQRAGTWRLYRTQRADWGRRDVPSQIPVPREVWKDWPRRQKPSRVPHEQISSYARRFAEENPQHALTSELKLFTAKAPLAKGIEEKLKARAWVEAEALLRRVLELDPADGRALLLVGLCRQGQGDLEAAEATYEQAAPLVGEDPDLYAFRGGLFELREDFAAAKASYRHAIEIASDHALALERLTGLGELVEIFLGDLDDPQKAYLPVENYEEVITEGWAQESRAAAFFLERSEYHLRNGQPSLALKAAVQAHEGENASDLEPAILAAECRAQIALAHFNEAEAALGQLADLAPENEEVFSCRGNLLWFRGDRAGAAEWIGRAIAANPNRIENIRLYLDSDYPREVQDPVAALGELGRVHPDAWAIKALAALVLMAREEWDAAIDLAHKCVRLGATDDALVELTGLMGRQGLDGEVVRLAEAGGGWRNYKQSNTFLRNNLAASLNQAGRVDEAVELWQGLLEDGQAHPDLRLRARAAIQAARGAR